MISKLPDSQAYFQGKKVLVAGGTGLIGIPLVKLLIARGAKVRIASLDASSRAHPKAEFLRLDLTKENNCREACQGMDYVFNLLCVKGSPAIMVARPASVFYPMILFNTMLMEAAYRSGTEGYLFTSSVGVYQPSAIFNEDDVWKTFPSPNDRFAGWVKRMGELQAEAYAIEFNWNRVSIVRPANIYGPYDNFDSANATVIPSLIKRLVDGENPFVIWGDGSPRRDFVHAADAAVGMLLIAESGFNKPVNLGSGHGVSIRQLVEIIAAHGHPKPEIVWDTSKPNGDLSRVMHTERAKQLGWQPSISLEQGLADTIDWYKAHRYETKDRYDVFNDNP